MQPDLVYDVGMGDGSDTAYYLFRGYRVVAIEANPDRVEQARTRFAQPLNSGRLTILHCAITDSTGPTTIWISERSDWTSLSRQIATRQNTAARAVDVPGRQFAGVLRDQGVPLFAKLDIEGAEMHCLDGLAELPLQERPQYLSIEMTKTNLLGLRQALRLPDLGYTRYQCINQGDFGSAVPPPARLSALLLSRLRALMPRTPAAARRTVETPQGTWTFPPGASGPFGLDLPGPWLPFTDALLGWLGTTRDNLGVTGVWHDLHAAREP